LFIDPVRHAMRANVSRIAIVLLLVVGCGRAKPPAPVVGSAPAALTMESAEPEAAPADAGQPRTASQWGDALTGADPEARESAGRALRDLGNQGFPYLLRGMQSPSWEVRLVSLRAAPKADVVANSSRTLPVLTGLVADRNPQIAQYAVIRLGWLGARGQSALPALKQKLAENEEQTQLKGDIVQAIIDIHETVPLLAGLLRDPNPLLRRQAAVRLLGLSKNGTRIDAAGPALAERVANDDDPEVRAVAKSALEMIR
jgi:HEAT repeat protein